MVPARRVEHPKLKDAASRMPTLPKLLTPSLPLDAELKAAKPLWLDFVWLIFLAGLALMPPLDEVRKYFILAGVGILQLFESRILSRLGERRGRFVVVLVKFLLSTLLLGVSGGVPINSTYYLIYYLPVVTAAFLYGLWGTLAWILVMAGAYISYLIPALEEFELTDVGLYELALRIIFIFLVGILVNRFVTETRRQTRRYQLLAETLADTNEKLKQAQEEARRSERLAALGQLSAGLAHEIRNPLGVIKGSAEMLNQRFQQSGSMEAELTGYIYSEVNRLNGLVSRFLDFARPLKIDPHSQDIVPVIEQSLKNVRAHYPEARLEVQTEYEAGMSPVMIDAGACEQVFTNLFSNAFEAVPGDGKLQITARAGDSDGHPGVEVQVEDSGPGIPAELRQQIFNPFFTTKKEGVGLGLSIVSKIVDNHQGWIRICSQEGQGACFRLFFPC